MHSRQVTWLALLVSTWIAGDPLPAADGVSVRIESPMSPPVWALLERELLRAHTTACAEFFDRYFDEHGYLLCVERWGGDDGPDDAMENLIHWPILHALGGSDTILEMYKRAWEGHLRQYTAARTIEVPFARGGMYYKEFPVMFDWLHNSEGLTVFNLQGLSDPEDVLFRHRVRRYAGFYMNEDPQAPNYDPQHRIIRSLFNGSRGPLLRKTTALDWAGDPIEVAGRFQLGHGEQSYEEMLEHFEDYNDVVGDHPSNLAATSLALNAYMLEHEPKYRRWILEYVVAWRERMVANDFIIPSNIGLDGTIGGETDGKWYGGVYGWAHTIVIPSHGKRVTRHISTVRLGFMGFANAFLLTGDEAYLDPWRKQIERINTQVKVSDGERLYPHMYGEGGWYDYRPRPYTDGALEIYYFTMRPEDRRWVPSSAWLSYLDDENPEFPERALRRDLDRVRRQVERIRADSSTPDTRLSDDSMGKNPASVRSLLELMCGGLIGNKNTLVLHARLRYFDPVRRRAGVPDDVAALIEGMTADSVDLVLVNVNQTESREVVVQAGAYAEHEFTSVSVNGRERRIESPTFTVHLEPGCGRRLAIGVRRHVRQPTLAFPWAASRR